MSSDASWRSLKNRVSPTTPSSSTPPTTVTTLGDRGFAGKWTHYEQSLRVPLIIYDPRLPENKRGRVLEELALNSDLASTMIDVAGLPSAGRPYGTQSCVCLVRGEDVSDWRTDFLCEFLAVPATIPRVGKVFVDTDWVYARYYVDGANEPPFEFLHDLENDPDQRINLALKLKDSDAMKQMRARCDELIAEAGPAMKDVGEDQRASRKKKQRTPRTRK